MVFAGEMAGPIAPTQAIGGLYIIGVDRGLGTPRFAGRTPVIGPNVLWDSVVRVNPDGTGLFNNIVAGVITPLTAADITINGNEFTASVPVIVMMPARSARARDERRTKPPRCRSDRSPPRLFLDGGGEVQRSSLAGAFGLVWPAARARGGYEGDRYLAASLACAIITG